MAESTGLLNLRGGNSTGGSNPPLSAIFFARTGKKNTKDVEDILHFTSQSDPSALHFAIRQTLTLIFDM